MLNKLFCIFLIKICLSVDFILEIVRHGARYPYFDIKIKNFKIKKSSLQELNQIGMKQHFLLGKQIRKKYPEIFEDKNNLEVSFISTPTNRTLISGISQIYGIFQKENISKKIENDNKNYFLPPFKTEKSKKTDFSDLKKKPLPKSYIPFPIKSYYTTKFKIQSKHCPKNLKKIKKFFLKTNKYHTEIFTNTFASIKKELKININKTDKQSFINLHKTCDAIISNFFLNKKINLSKKILEQCNYVEAVNQFSVLIDEDLRKSLFSVMWYEFKKKFDDFLKNEKKKFTAVFVHDYVLYPFLFVLEKNLYVCTVYNYVQEFNRDFVKDFFSYEKLCSDFFFFRGTYASSLIFEISRNEIGSYNKNKKKLEDYNVKVFFNNKLMSFFKEKKTLKDLYNLFEDNCFKEKDLNQICGRNFIKKENKINFFDFYFVFFVCLCFFIFILLIYLINIIRKVKYIKSKVTLIKTFGNSYEKNKLN